MPSPPVVAKVRYSQYHNWRRHISHSHLNFQVPEVSSEELLLSRLIRCELSRLRCHGHSLLLSSYLRRISRKENSDCSACGHPLQDLNHLLLDCPASEPLRKSIFGFSLFLTYGPDLGVWPDSWVFAEFLRAPIPRKGSGSTTTTVSAIIVSEKCIKANFCYQGLREVVLGQYLNCKILHGGGDAFADLTKRIWHTKVL